MTIIETNIQSKKVRIFYADDDPDDAFFFRSIIEESGLDCELYIFKSGVELLERINVHQNLHHVIFLDVNMPFKNGFECLNEIRNNEDLSSVPVYMISTSNSDTYREKSLELGALDYIQKPSNFNTLKERIKDAILSSIAS